MDTAPKPTMEMAPKPKSKRPDTLTPTVISFLAVGAFLFVWWLAIR